MASPAHMPKGKIIVSCRQMAGREAKCRGLADMTVTCHEPCCLFMTPRMEPCLTWGGGILRPCVRPTYRNCDDATSVCRRSR